MVESKKFTTDCIIGFGQLFSLAKKIIVERTAVTVGYHTGTWRLCLGLQFQHVVLKIIYEGSTTNYIVVTEALY